MAILFADGFDTYHRLQDVAARWSSSRTFDYNNSTSAELVAGRRSGGKAIILGDPSLSGSGGTGTSLYTTITPSSECVVAFAIKPDYNAAGTGGATNAYHPLVTFASGSTMFLRVVRHAQTGVIAAYLGGSDTNFHDVGTYAGATALTNSLNGLATGTTALTQADWNHIQVVYKAADSGGSISVRLNGVEVWAFSGDTKPGAGTTFDTIAFYAGQATTGTSADNAGLGVFVAHDDIVIVTGTTPIGDAGVVALQANGNGNSTDWTATGTALGASGLSSSTITFGSSFSGGAAVLYDGQSSNNASGLGLANPTTVGTGTNAWIRMDYGSATDIAGWRWVQKNGGTGTALTSPTQKLQGSADGTTWTDLDSLSVTTTNNYDSGVRAITTANYRYFRFKIDCTSGATGGLFSSIITELELFPPLASTAFNQFAETPNLTSTYLQGDALDEIQLATFSDLGTTIGTVVGVQQRVIAGADSGSGTLIPVTRVSGTNYTGTSITVSGAGSDKTIVWDTNPATSAAWTRGQINGAEFGAKVG